MTFPGRGSVAASLNPCVVDLGIAGAQSEATGRYGILETTLSYSPGSLGAAAL